MVEERKRSAVGRARRDYPQLKQRSHLIPAKCGTPNVARGSVKTGAWGSKEKGYQRLVETFRWVGHRFTGGMLIPADIVSFESGDLAYTVGFERGEVSVDANAPASMTIRVTHIYRRIDGEWYLVHRYADFPPSDQRARDQGNAGSARALMSAVLLTAARKRTLSKVRLGPSGSQPRICARSYSDRRPVFLRSSFAKGAGA